MDLPLYHHFRHNRVDHHYHTGEGEQENAEAKHERVPVVKRILGVHHVRVDVSWVIQVEFY